MWRRLVGGRESEEQLRAQRKPSADDFTTEAVRRELLQQTLQHPATILPLSVALVAGLWSAVIALTAPSLLVMLASGFVAASAWVYNFVVRGEDLAARHIRRLRECRAAIDQRDGEAVVEQCERAGFAEGAKEARDLHVAFEKLQRFLERRAGGAEDLAAERFRILAEDSHQEGVRSLRRALSIFEALRSIDVDVLIAERDKWAAARELAAAADRVVLDRRIGSNDKRIALYRERERVLPLLLAETNEIESALENAYLAAVDLVGEDARAPFESGRAATELEAAVQAARRVEARLRELGVRENDNEQEYIEAARRTSG
jgi:hypothetical protein